MFGVGVYHLEHPHLTVECLGSSPGFAFNYTFLVMHHTLAEAVRKEGFILYQMQLEDRTIIDGLSYQILSRKRAK